MKKRRKKKYTNYIIITVHKEEQKSQTKDYIIYISISLILTHIMSLLLEILITQW